MTRQVIKDLRRRKQMWRALTSLKKGQKCVKRQTVEQMMGNAQNAER